MSTAMFEDRARPLLEHRGRRGLNHNVRPGRKQRGNVDIKGAAIFLRRCATSGFVAIGQAEKFPRAPPLQNKRLRQ